MFTGTRPSRAAGGMAKRVWRVALGIMSLATVNWTVEADGMSGAFLEPVAGHNTSDRHLGYQTPPPLMASLIETKPLPYVSVSPDGRWLILTDREGLPRISSMTGSSISVLTQRIDPQTRAPKVDPSATGIAMTLINVESGQRTALDVPHDKLSIPLWSPDSLHFLFRHTAHESVELWIGDIPSRRVRHLIGIRLRALDSVGAPCVWMPDKRRVLCKSEPIQQPEPSVALIASEPTVQETEQNTAYPMPSPSLLRNAQDETTFDFYFTSQLVVIDMVTGEQSPLGSPGIYDVIEPSPSGEYFISMRTIRPYSYEDENSYVFAKQLDILDKNGRLVTTLAKRPVVRWGNLATGRAVPGMRRVAWLPNAPSTIVYIEALDGGSAAGQFEYRDRLMRVEAPFTNPPEEIARTRGRMSAAREGTRYLWGNHGANFAWLKNGFAWMEEVDLERNRKRTWKVRVRGAPATPDLLLDESNDGHLSAAARNPLPLMGRIQGSSAGTSVATLQQSGDSVFLIGEEASSLGARPFLDRFDLHSHKSQRIFQSGPTSYERVLAVLPNGRLLTQHETANEPANLFIRDLRTRKAVAITDRKNPGDWLPDLRPKLIHYVRSDGVSLSGFLYLPGGSIPRKPLPTLIYGYPYEYFSKEAAAEVRDSANQYALEQSVPFEAGIRLLATQGYAVLFDAAMPLVSSQFGDDKVVEQLVSSAHAAVSQLVEMGVADRTKIAIAGHSFGGTMVAVLLANTDLFAAGVAIDGSFNWSHEPFGFQYERRTLWQAPKAYLSLSALFQADQIHAPLLLVHGELDNAPGTSPLESQAMYLALQGLGSKARLVMLPYENHVPGAKESIETLSWETLRWLDRYLKGQSQVGVETQSLPTLEY